MIDKMEAAVTECKLKTCGAEIVWTTTEARGASMPVDFMPTDNGNVLVYLQGDQLMSRVIPNASPGDLLHTSHFATCPGANSFRKGRTHG